MKKIRLANGMFAKVSNHRFEELNKRTWTAKWSEETNSYYAVSKESIDGKQVQITMGRFIMKTPENMYCDHKNHDTLDNQDENLRNCTPSQNSMNRKMRSDNTSGYKGVSKNETRWRAEVKKNGVRVFSKNFPTAEEAALAYDKEARKHFGEFAYLNFPEK